MKPNCYNRQAFKGTVIVQDGWIYGVVEIGPSGTMRTRKPRMVEILDPMSKGCQQHGPLGEATLHPEAWDCAGCVHKPKEAANEEAR